MARSRGADEVGAFLDGAQTARAQAKSRLIELEAQRGAANLRLDRLRPSLAHQNDVLDELLARDEELAAVQDELRAQIASQEQTFALLERERAKYLDFFVSAPDPYVVTDLHGITQEANLRAAGLFNVAPNFLAGRPLVSFVSRQDTRLFRTLLREVEDADGAVRSALIRMRPRGQAPFVVAARVALVRSLAGRPVAARWTLRQVNASEVRQAAWLVDSELARLLQDLRRPLAAIQTWVRSLRDGELRDEQDRAQALAWIEKTAADEITLLDELRELGELDVEEGERTPVDLLEQVRAVVAVVRPEMAPWRVPAAPVLVSGRADLLRRALVVLLRRAQAAHPHGTPVPRIEISVSGNHAVVNIAAHEESRPPPGWGVRLALASRIADGHGGRLIVRDTNAGAELHLPLAAAAMQSGLVPIGS